MRKLIPYIGTGVATGLLILWLLMLSFARGTPPEVKRLQAQVDSLKTTAQALRDTIAARDRRVSGALGEIAALNRQIAQVRTINSLMLDKLRQDWRVRDKSDAQLLAGLNRAHGDTAWLTRAGSVRR